MQRPLISSLGSAIFNTRLSRNALLTLISCNFFVTVGRAERNVAYHFNLTVLIAPSNSVAAMFLAENMKLLRSQKMDTDNAHTDVMLSCIREDFFSLVRKLFADYHTYIHTRASFISVSQYTLSAKRIYSNDPLIEYSMKTQYPTHTQLHKFPLIIGYFNAAAASRSF